VTLIIDDDWQVVDNLEVVTYLTKTAPDTWNAGASVPNVLRRARDKTFADTGKNLQVQEIVFHAWASQLAAAQVGGPPKINDKIVDADGLRYVVKEVQVHCFYTRYRLTCVREQ